MMTMYKYRYLMVRRIVQFSVLLLFAGSNYFGWTVLKGNLSSALLFGEIQLSDPYAVLQILATGFWVGTDILISAGVVLLFYTLISGRMFCSWVCPMNPVTDFARWLKRKFQDENSKGQITKNLRYWILGLSIVLSAITGLAAFETISPIGFLHRAIVFGAGTGWAVVLVIFFFDVGIVKNGWCGHLCPLGAFYAIIGNIGFLKVKHIKENCTNCNACFKVCPEVQVLDIVGKKDGFIKSGECTNCARCIEVCEDEALKFSITVLKK